MERITAKEVTSMMEALSRVYEQPEVEQLDEVANDPRSGFVGQLERQRRKMFGTPSEVNQSASYEASLNALTKGRGPGNVPLGADGKPITAAQIAAETKRRRLADPNYKPGQGVDSGAKPGSGGTPTETKPTDDGGGGGGGGGNNPPPAPKVVTAKNASGQQQKVTVGRKYDATLGGQKGTVTYDAAGKRTFTANKPTGGNTPTETKPTETKPTETRPAPVKTFKVGDKQMSKAQINARYAELRKTDPKAAKEFGNQAFAATNSKIAAANAERSRIRGTAQTNNPLIDKQMRSRMPVNSPSVQSSEVSKLGKGNQSLSNNPNAFRAAKPSAASSTTTSSGSVKQEIAAVKSGMSANQQSGVKSAVQGAVRNVGNTAKTKVNPDSSRTLTQQRSAAETKKIKSRLDLQSADLFDIVKGEFINEGYSEEDTMYMMANLNEEQLQEFLGQLARVAIKNYNKIPGVKGVVSKVGRMFGRSPKPTRIPAGDIGAMRLRQGQATDAVNRLNKSTAASKANDATRAATREKNRLNNLDPRAVSDRNAREAASQVMQRNRELGRPSWYNPNNPGSEAALKRYYAAKREGVKGLPD